jgi:peptide/nickel transport system substrate-binding protein
MWRFLLTIVFMFTCTVALAKEPKSGGVLRIYQRDSPASASLLEEATISANVPFMAIFNNLILFDQNKPTNSDQTIVPELATAWAWSDDHLRLTFTLRDGVTWHDGKPFTAADVKCTFALLRETGTDRLRRNPRKLWYANVAEVSTNGDREVSLRLTRPQPSLLAMLASGDSPIYPCHVNAARMRTNPIGTGPFKLAEFRQNEVIRLVRNTNYWKPGRPYLDGIELPIITNRATAMLAFVAGKLDMTFPTEVTLPTLRDIKREAPRAICHFGPTNLSENVIINRERPPFNDADVRRAMALAIDRHAFASILFEGQADTGSVLLPTPSGIWGMPEEMKRTLLGFDPDVAKNRTEARAIMERRGYGPQKRIPVKVSIRNLAVYRDPAIILIDHLKEIYIDGELDPIETSLWFPKLARKNYVIGLNITANAIDDPDQAFYENFACGSERNYSQYCNPELEKKFDLQSAEFDLAKRRLLVWDIDRNLHDDVARPIILHMHGGTCWQPRVQGYVPMVNSSLNGYRFEDVWLDQ